MYSMVMMMAMTGAPEVPSFGFAKHGCQGGCGGVVVTVQSHGCQGATAGCTGHTCHGGCGGFLGLGIANKVHNCLSSLCQPKSCHGGCGGHTAGCQGGGGCHGHVIVQPAPMTTPKAMPVEPKKVENKAPEKK